MDYNLTTVKTNYNLTTVNISTTMTTTTKTSSLSSASIELDEKNYLNDQPIQNFSSSTEVQFELLNDTQTYQETGRNQIN